MAVPPGEQLEGYTSYYGSSLLYVYDVACWDGRTTLKATKCLLTMPLQARACCAHAMRRPRWPGPQAARQCVPATYTPLNLARTVVCTQAPPTAC